MTIAPERAPDRSLPTIRAKLVEIHRDLGALGTDLLNAPSPWLLVLRRGAMTALERRFDELALAFMNVDSDLVIHAQSRVSGDLNSLLASASLMQLHFGMRDSVRGILADVGGRIAALRNDIAFRESLIAACFAIALAAVSAFVDVRGLLFGGHS